MAKINNQSQIIMRRLFYPKSSLVGQWLESNSNVVRHQDEIFLKAMLGSLRANYAVNHTIKKDELMKQRQRIDKELPDLHQKVLDMAILEQETYATHTYLQHIYSHLFALHKHSRGNEMITNSAELDQKSSRALVDPDKFPIWDLKQQFPTYRSLWARVLGKIRCDLGFQMIVRESRVQHIEGGNGVYLVMRKSNQKSLLPTGSLLGFVPGSVYSNIRSFRSTRLKRLSNYEKPPYYLQFPSGKVLQFSDLEYNISLNLQRRGQTVRIQPTFLNPYSLGHMLNHPLPGARNNVCFIQFQIPVKFFPRYLTKYLPYQYYLGKSIQKSKTLPIFCMISLEQLKHNDELFVNYFDNHVYQHGDNRIDAMEKPQFPEWMIEPPPLNNYFIKGQYENPPKFYWDAVQRTVMNNREKEFQQYRSKVKFHPSNKVLFQNDEVRVRQLVRKKGLSHYEQDKQ